MEDKKKEALASLSVAKKELKNAASLLFAMHLDKVATNMGEDKSYESIVDMLGDLTDFIEGL